MAAFPLPAGHPFASVRPGYAGFESTPDGSVINATASYVGASGDYPANAINLQLFATQGGTWTVGTPAGLTVQTPPVVNQAYTTAVYTGGLRGQTYTFTTISLTPAQGAQLGWLGTAPSVTLTIPTNTTTIASGYYVGGNAGGIYLTPVLDPTLTPIVQGITNYFFVCTTSAAYASVDSIGTAIIPFPTGTTFTAGTTTPLNFTVQCRSNGILGQSSTPFTVSIVQPAVPSLTGVISGNNINLTFSSTTPGCAFDLSYSGAITATGITSPYSYTTTVPGAYTFQVQASLCGLTTFSLPSTTTIFPAQPAGVTSTVSGLSISLAWTSPVGTGYTYNVSGTGLATQTVSVPTAQFTNLQVGLPTFFIQSVYAGIRSTTCNVQVSIPTTRPYNFRGAASSSTITLSWANDTPGATFTLSSSSPSTLATQFGLTTSNYTYTGIPGGSYSFTVFSTSAGIPSSPATVAGLVALSAPTNFAITTLGSTANLTWQNATLGASFNVSYTVGSTLTSRAVGSGLTTTSIPNLPAGNYTFGIQTIVTGGSSSFTTATAIIVAAPTSFTATSLGIAISLSWFESTPGCTFTVTNPILGTQTTTDSNVQYTGTAGTSYIFTLTPCNTASFIGPSVTTTGTILSTPIPTAVLSGINVDVSWPAVTGTGMTYTVSSSPGVPNPPAQPGSLRSVSFVTPPPAQYRFNVVAFDSSGNVSVAGTTALLTVPVPQPTGVGLTMTASSQLTVTWTETLPECTFTYQNGPTGVTPIVTNVGTSYTAVFNGVPLLTVYSPFTITATFNGINSLASAAVNNFRTFPSFNVTLSATCSQSGSTNNATATYTVNDPVIWNNVYGPPGLLTNPVTIGFSGTALPPPILTASAGYAGSYGLLWWGKWAAISNMIPTTFGQFVVPPTSLTVTANGTNLLVKWADSTTAGCRYTVVGTPGTFTCNVAAGSGSTGITFTNAAIGTAYTFIITASSAGTYTASRYYEPYGGSIVTTENATIPYTITSVSVPSTAVTPINFPATFTATATGTTIAINWGAVTGATSYNVFNGGSALFSTTTATSCNYAGQAGTTYTLTVQANGASVSNTSPTAITVTPLAAPVITSIAQSGSNITVTSTGTGLSINTPAGLSAPTGTSTFNFTGALGNTAYSFTVTATGTNATSSATSGFTTLGTPAITSATAQGTATITVNWSYTGPNVSGFTVYSNSISTTSVGPAVRTAIFAQSATTNNADTVYVVANGTVGSSIQSASLTVSDLVTPPTLTSSTVNALSFTVQWTYPTTARALSDFQVCNSTQTILYSTVQYVANQLNYNSLFNVPSIAAYSFVIVGRDSVGSTISSAASTSVTPVAAPTITSVVQTGSTITLSATGTGLSTPTVSPTLSTVSTVSPWSFTGASGNTTYTFNVRANGTNASNTTTCNITTLSTPVAPTLTAVGTTITVTWPAAGAYNIYSNTSLVTPATSNTTNATITSGIIAGTTYTYTIALTSGGYTSVPSPAASITIIAPPANTLVTQSGANIVVRCDPSTAIFTVTASTSIAGSYTYPLTSFIGGSVSLSATIIGGGGGGGAGGNGLNAPGGAGGGSGGRNTVVCNAVTSIAYILGSAGAGGIMSTAPTSGSTGGTSTITLNGASTATATATGGGGGGNANTTGSGGTPGGFSGGVGGVNAIGGTGAGGGGQGGEKGYNNSQGGGGGGGGPGGGNGGAGQLTQTTTGVAGNGSNGSQAGAGGGGGGSIYVLGSGGNGGKGADGGVILSMTGRQFTPLSIPNPPTGLTLVSSTLSSFVYSGYTAGTTYTFTIQATIPGSTNTVTGSVTPLFTPGTPTVTAAEATVTITWTYGASPTGITFNVRDGNNNWAGTSVTGSLTTSFTGESGKSYSIFVFATSGGNQSPNSAATSTTIVVLGTLTFTQNYQLTTQTRIVGTAAATGAASYSGTTDSTSALSAAAVTGQTLTWTGAVGGRAYTGVTIGAAAGAATTSLANRSLYSAFDPKTIPGCVLWLDAADSTTVTGTSSVTGWADKSGLGYNMANGGTGTTMYTTYGPGPSIKLNTSYLFVNKAVNLQQYTVFSVVLSQTALHNQPTITGRPNTLESYNSTDGFGLYVDSDLPRLRFYGTNISFPTLNTTTAGTNAQPLVLSSYTCSSAGAVFSWINGAAGGSTTSGGSARTTTAQGFSIGGEWNGSVYVSQSGTRCVANVYEVIVFNTVLTTIQRQLIERYLAWKWGLQTQLDPGFPFNNFPGTLPLPNTIAGLALWLDAADTTTITKNGVNLATIKDKSGTNNSWSAGGTSATTFGTIGGIQCIRFNGFSTSSITGTYSLTQGQNLTMFLAFNSVNSSQVDLFNDGPSIIFNQGGILQLVNKTNYNLNYESTVNIPASANKTYVVALTSTITNSTTASSFAVVNGTVYTINANGYSFVSSGTSTFTASTIAYNPWSLGELVVYSGVLTNTQIQQVSAYLIYKWKAY